MSKTKLNEIIIENRKKRGLTQVELAKKMNLSSKTISKWETGVTNPDFESLVKLSQILEIDINNLFDSFDKEEESKKLNSHINKDIVSFIYNVIGIAMGIAVVVLKALDKLDVNNGLIMLGLGLLCIGLSLLNNKNSR